MRLSSRWPHWAGYAAAAWSLGYAALALYWARGGAGFPFGAGNDPAAHLSLLGAVTRESAAPVLAAVLLLAGVIALVMARGAGRGIMRMLVLVFGWSLAAVLALLIPDYRLLVIVAYAPILIIGAPFGWPGDVNLGDAIPWAVVNQLVCAIGGILWAAAATSYARRTAGACVYCGRTDAREGWKTPESALRWGRRAVGGAILVPLVYATTRWAWALGVPLGITDEFLAEGAGTGLWWIGAALALLAVIGALLSLGLVRRWGEVFPQWIPGVGGRRVPPKLVIVPALFVALLVTVAGLMFVRFAISGTFSIGGHSITLHENVGALLPELLWPAWGVALAAAALAYHVRTRGRCARCGRL